MTTPAGPRPIFNDRVLYVGMNESSAEVEARAVHASTKIVAKTDDSFATYEDCHTFAASLGLPEDQTARVAQVIFRAPETGRDELAAIASAWAPAEEGGAIPSRLVLSGHCAGDSMWGNSSILRLADVCALGRAMPKAAAQLEDIHFAGCFTEKQLGERARWTQAFPNVKTLWGYREYSPLAPVGHLADWERATRGRADDLHEGFVARHTHATAWSIAGGVVASGASVEEKRARAADADRRYEAYVSGETRIPNAHAGSAESDYAAYRSLAADPSATAAERKDAATKADTLLRLRFYEQSVRDEIARAHPNLPFDVAHLSRKEALAAIDAYAGDDPATLRALQGIANLSPGAVPEKWCH